MPCSHPRHVINASYACVEKRVHSCAGEMVLSVMYMNVNLIKVFVFVLCYNSLVQVLPNWWIISTGYTYCFRNVILFLCLGAYRLCERKSAHFSAKARDQM